MKLLHIQGAHRRQRLHLNSVTCIERGHEGPVHLLLEVGDGGEETTGLICLKRSQVQRLRYALAECLMKWPEP